MSPVIAMHKPFDIQTSDSIEAVKDTDGQYSSQTKNFANDQVTSVVNENLSTFMLDEEAEGWHNTGDLKTRRVHRHARISIMLISANGTSEF